MRSSTLRRTRAMPVSDYRCPHCGAAPFLKNRTAYTKDPVMIVHVEHDTYCPIRAMKAKWKGFE